MKIDRASACPRLDQTWSCLTSEKRRCSCVALAFCLLAGILAPLAARAAEERASDGKAYDYFGSAVSESGSTGLVGAYRAKIGNAAQGAAYVYRGLDATSGTVTQNVKLTASDGAANNDFGISVSESGSTGLVGADGANAAQGAAYVYRGLDTATGAVTQNVEITASDGKAGDAFGGAVSLSGSTGLVGAAEATVGGNTYQGAAYVYQFLDSFTGTVTQNVKLTASDGQASDSFGEAVSLSGSTGLVGANGATVGGNTYQGAAYIFRGLDRAGGIVNQNAKLTASDGQANDGFGVAVSLSGSTGLVGANEATVGGNTYQGAAYVYRGLDTAAGTVTQNVKLTASDGAAEDFFGGAVSLSGSTGLVGAALATVGGNTQQGAAYVYRALDTATGTMTQSVKLTASDGAANDGFGVAVSLDGDRFLIGANGANSSTGRSYNGTVSSVTTLDAGNTTGVINGVNFVSQDNWIIGAITSTNQVTLSKGDAANVTATGKGVFIGQSAGSNNNTLLVQGTVVANSVTISATGATGNKLEIANDGTTTAGTVSAVSGLFVSIGGQLLLSGTSAVTDRLGASTPVTVASGGTLATSGLSEGISATGQAAGFGKLTLAAGSTLDFAVGANGSTLLASAGAVTGTGTLSIRNWSGTINGDNGAAGNDRLLFITDPGFTTAQLGQFQFYNDSGTAFAVGAKEFSYNGYTEIVPIPEPATIYRGILLAGLAMVHCYRRQRAAAHGHAA